MASAGTTRAAGDWPRRRLALAILAVSVALNVFFIAGALWTGVRPQPTRPGIEQRYQRIAAELELDPRQRAGFDKFIAAMRGRSERMQQLIAPLTGAAWEEIAKPEADTAQALRLFDEAAEKRRVLQHESMAQTVEFMTLLTPAQRIKFVALARERRGSWRQPPAQNR